MLETALLFSGQGSQYVGMLGDIYEKYTYVRELVETADSVLGYKLSEICFEGPADLLKETRYTQPAIFLHSAAVFGLLREKIVFKAVAGHSVGEYAALYAAGAVSFEDALKLVSLRGSLMFGAGENEPGTMFAIIGLDEKKVVEICEKLTENGNGKVIVPANYNSPGQIVVSGSASYLRENAVSFKEAGAKMVNELVVSGAFHSPLMKPAEDELRKAIIDTRFDNAAVPVYCNVDAKPHISAEELQDLLIKQLTSPVCWTQILKAMAKDGINNFIELGPGKVLQGLVKRTLSDVGFTGADKAGDIEKF